MTRPVEKIADSELLILRVLWDAKRPLPVADIRKTIRLRSGWEDSTVKTLLYRLLGKGVVTQEKRDVFYYSPAVSEKEYNDYTTEKLIDRLYNGSAKNLIASFLSSKKLSDDDIAELRNMFRDGERS